MHLTTETLMSLTSMLPHLSSPAPQVCGIYSRWILLTICDVTHTPAATVNTVFSVKAPMSGGPLTISVAFISNRVQFYPWGLLTPITQLTNATFETWSVWFGNTSSGVYNAKGILQCCSRFWIYLGSLDSIKVNIYSFHIIEFWHCWKMCFCYFLTHSLSLAKSCNCMAFVRF